MKRFYLKSLLISVILLCASLLAFSLLVIFTINPITYYAQIEQTKGILAKIKTYDSLQSAPPPETRNLTLWQAINFDKTENDFIEKTGFNVTINSKNAYIGILSNGFDNRIFYNYSQNCWYSEHVKIIGLPICKDKVS